MCWFNVHSVAMDTYSGDGYFKPTAEQVMRANNINVMRDFISGRNGLHDVIANVINDTSFIGSDNIIQHHNEIHDEILRIQMEQMCTLIEAVEVAALKEYESVFAFYRYRK